MVGSLDFQVASEYDHAMEQGNLDDDLLELWLEENPIHTCDPLPPEEGARVYELLKSITGSHLN